MWVQIRTYTIYNRQHGGFDFSCSYHTNCVCAPLSDVVFVLFSLQSGPITQIPFLTYQTGRRPLGAEVRTLIAFADYYWGSTFGETKAVLIHAIVVVSSHGERCQPHGVHYQGKGLD